MELQSNPLFQCLTDLNRWLAENELTIQIKVIGRFAFFLSGIQNVFTLDIDSITEIEDRVFKKVIEIGKRRGMKPEWLNDSADTLPLPEGFHERLIPLYHFSNIELKYAARLDLIYLKAAAYISRGADDPKDFQDLLTLEPTPPEIDEAIRYIRKHYSPPNTRFFPDFEDKLNELKSIPKK